MFYRVEIFEAGALSGIEFFDSNELEQAQQRAIAAVDKDGAGRADVHDDSGRLVFRYPVPTAQLM